MKNRLYGVMGGWVCALLIGLTPALSSAMCIMESSGAIYNFDIHIGGGLTGTIEVPGVCTPSPIIGASTQTLGGQVEIGLSVYFNTITTGCVPHATLSASLNTDLQGSGTLLRFNTEGAVMSEEVTISPCDSGVILKGSTGQSTSSSASWRVAD